MGPIDKQHQTELLYFFLCHSRKIKRFQTGSRFISRLMLLRFLASLENGLTLLGKIREQYRLEIQRIFMPILQLVLKLEIFRFYKLQSLFLNWRTKRTSWQTPESGNFKLCPNVWETKHEFEIFIFLKFYVFISVFIYISDLKYFDYGQFHLVPLFRKY